MTRGGLDKEDRSVADDRAALVSLLPRIVMCAASLALLRTWRSWMFSLIAQEMGDAAFWGCTPRDGFTLGTILGTVLVLVLVRHFMSLARCKAAAFGLAAVVAGTVLAVPFYLLGEAPPLQAAAPLTFLPSMGFAVLMAVWAEWMGRFSPAAVLIAYVGSWPINVVLRISLSYLPAHLACAEAVTLPVLSMAVLALDRIAWRSSAQGEACTSGVETASCAVPGMLTSQQIWIVVWTCVFTVAYGIGTSYSGLGYSNLATAVGETVPLLVIGAGFIGAGLRFDYTQIYRVAMGLLVLGFAVAVFSGENIVAIQACLSAANVIITSLAVTFMCGSAALRRTSAAWTYGLLSLGWYVATLLTRVFMRAIGLTPTMTVLLFAVVALGILALLAMASSKRFDLLAYWRGVCSMATAGPVAARCSRVARNADLSEREEGVLVLLMEGKTASEIAEQLFIAPGTVRAHTGHTYEKLGVHTRAELVDLVDRVELE